MLPDWCDCITFTDRSDINVTFVNCQNRQFGLHFRSSPEKFPMHAQPAEKDYCQWPMTGVFLNFPSTDISWGSPCSCITSSVISFERFGQFLFLFKRGGGGVLKAKITKSIISQLIFIWKALSQEQKIRKGKSIHFLKALFKTYPKTNVCWMLLSKNIRHQR